MELLDDGIHDCKECKIYKEYGVTCSLQSELDVPSCKYCDTRMCCRSPALPLVRCEQNTILDKIDEGEYVEFEGIIPFNIETRYCKHIDMKTMDCKVYNQRPIACRIAGSDCLGDFWVKTIKEQHEKNMKDEEFEQFKNELVKQKKRVDEKIDPIKQSYEEGKITKREFVEKLADAFHKLEEN